MMQIAKVGFHPRLIFAQGGGAFAPPRLPARHKGLSRPLRKGSKVRLELRGPVALCEMQAARGAPGPKDGAERPLLFAKPGRRRGGGRLPLRIGTIIEHVR